MLHFLFSKGHSWRCYPDENDAGRMLVEHLRSHRSRNDVADPLDVPDRASRLEPVTDELSYFPPEFISFGEWNRQSTVITNYGQAS
jgi:hypothetical protein